MDARLSPAQAYQTPERGEACLEPSRDPGQYELDCARQIVSILFQHTGLATVVNDSPVVTVGEGNWISFAADQPLSSETVLALRKPGGAPAFRADVIHPSNRARSRTSPSLHLINVNSGETLRGHVDAYYWARNPLRHADEFFAGKTAHPSDLLRRLRGLR